MKLIIGIRIAGLCCWPILAIVKGFRPPGHDVVVYATEWPNCNEVILLYKAYCSQVDNFADKLNDEKTYSIESL